MSESLRTDYYGYTVKCTVCQRTKKPWGQDRKFVGCELKESYWLQACQNLAVAEREARPMDLFAETA